MNIFSRDQKVEELNAYQQLFINAVSRDDIAQVSDILLKYKPQEFSISPLHIAVSHNNVEMLKLLLQLEIFDVNFMEHGQSLLHKLAHSTSDTTCKI
ncbi:Ankyrin_repeats-containing protein [Hexamita inflata]|uniref:Ankyrin repeats-containing protein n=1 Tax=Hexamita inflata TaxID=28002 RepID=A0AA86PVZ5_9EUKA|nr:Ankyrin repeats-containing protein [Hexamita inflata]